MSNNETSFTFDDKTHRVSETADKYVAETKVTRGTGTRDQEATKLRAKGNTPEDAMANLETMVEAYTDIGETLRAFQPETDDDD